MAEDLDQPLGHFVADTGLDQNRLPTGTHHDRIQANGNVVLGIGFHFLLPHDFGDDAEERSSVEAVGAVGDGNQFEVAERQTVHESASCFHGII